MALAVVADQAQYRHAQAERAQVSRYGAGRAGLGDHLDDLVSFQSGLDRALGQRRVDHQVAVQKEIADDQDVDAGEAVGELAETWFVHRRKTENGKRKTENGKRKTENEKRKA